MSNGIEDTSTRHPLTHLVGALGGTDDYIRDMERDGQRQLVTSDRLPSEILYATQAEFEALGFTFGDVDPHDPLFRPATLPEGWKREGSDHAMWSYIADERGIRRVGVFYKAAFYDRKAHMSLKRVGYDIVTEAVYADGMPPTPWAVLTGDELAEVATGIRAQRERAAEYPDIYGEHGPRVDLLAAQYDAEIARRS